MTREEFESILEEAFMAGYEDAYEEIFEEDSSFDLESEMDSYNEDDSSFDLEDECGYYNEARDDTKFDRFRKAVVKGLDAPAKELGVSNKTRKELGKTALAITGKMNPKLKAKAFANHVFKGIKGAVKDSNRVTKNAVQMASDARSRAREVEPELDKLDHSGTLMKKGEILSRLAKRAGERAQEKVRRMTGDTEPKQRGKSGQFYFNSEEEANKSFNKLNKWHDKHKTGKRYSV